MNAIVKKHYVAVPRQQASSHYFSGLYSQPEAVIRIFAFPFAGGDISAFYSWFDWLPKNVELVRVQLPGRGLRQSESTPSSMQDLAAAICAALEGIEHKPSIFFGYSMGALLAHAVISNMCTAGMRSPVLFCAAACNPPHLHQKNWMQMSDATLCHLLSRSDELWMQNIPAEKRQANLCLTRNDLNLCQNYVQTKANFLQRLHCPIATFGGDSDTIAPIENLFFWRDYTVASCVSHRLVGGHFFLLNSTKPLLPTLLMRELDPLIKKFNKK